MMIAAALPAVAAGMLLVRLGWGARRAVAIAGWLLALAGMVLATWAGGAWGCALATLTAMAVAIAALGYAAWRSPVREHRPMARRTCAATPITPRDVARRLAVFLLVVPLGFVAAQMLALALWHVAAAHGSNPADATVLAWVVQPVAWTALMTVQMTRAGPAQMIAPPLVVAAAGLAIWALP